MLLLFPVLVAVVSLLVGHLFDWGFNWGFKTQNPFQWLSPVALRASGGTAALILAVSLFKIWELNRGGSVVAEMIGGRRLGFETQDPSEKRLMNVVEEMAIASGVSMPEVYVLDHEPGLNAFAAGFEPTQSAIIVTRGLVEALNRDELQGVIGHEFSHILNGDMALNVRIMGAVSGLVFLVRMGRALLRTGSRSVRTRGRKGGNPFPLIGLGLIVIGGIGVLFARFLQAIVSREREFLADASAVQFTRNPLGIGAALAKIKLLSGSQIESSHRDELGHLFFAQGVRPIPFLGNLLATHPPLDARIERLAPELLVPGAVEKLVEKATSQRHPLISELNVLGVSPQLHSEDLVMKSVAVPSMSYARSFLQDLPSELELELRDPEQAKAAVLAIALAEEEDSHHEQALHWIGELNSNAAHVAHHIREFLAKKGRHLRYPVLTIALGTLRPLALSERETIVESLRQVARTFSKPVPWTVFLQTRATLIPGSQVKEDLRSAVSFGLHVDDLRYVLSWISSFSTLDEAARRTAEQDALSLVTTVRNGDAPPSHFEIERLERHLLRMKRLAPAWKERVVSAVWKTALADKHLALNEAEAVRSICLCLGVPMPPLGSLALSENKTLTA